MAEGKATFQKPSSFLSSQNYIMQQMKAPNSHGMKNIANTGRS